MGERNGNLNDTPRDKLWRVMNLVRIASLALIGIVGLCAAACGGGSSPASTTQTSASASNEIVALSLQPNAVTLRSDNLVNQVIVLQLTARNSAGVAVNLDMNTVTATTSNACVPVSVLSSGIGVACNVTCRGGGGTDNSVVTVTAPSAPGSSKTVTTTAKAACTG